MVNYQTTSFWEQNLSCEGHNLLLVKSSGDDYKSVTLHCTGGAHPYLVEEGEVDGECGWSGPNIRPGRWHEKHIEKAWAGHLGYVADHGRIEHGVKGNFPDVCRCYDCRNGHRPGEPW